MVRDERYCNRIVPPGDASAKSGLRAANPQIRSNRQDLTRGSNRQDLTRGSNRQDLTQTIETVLSSELSGFAGCDQDARRRDDARSNSHSMKRAMVRGFSLGE